MIENQAGEEVHTVFAGEEGEQDTGRGNGRGLHYPAGLRKDRPGGGLPFRGEFRGKEEI